MAFGSQCGPSIRFACRGAGMVVGQLSSPGNKTQGERALGFQFPAFGGETASNSAEPRADRSFQQSETDNIPLRMAAAEAVGDRPERQQNIDCRTVVGAAEGL